MPFFSFCWCLLAPLCYLFPGMHAILLWEDILWSFLVSCSNIDSLLSRSAVQLHPWNFFSLESWVSDNHFLIYWDLYLPLYNWTRKFHVPGFSPLLCILPKPSCTWYKNKRSTIWTLTCLKMSLFCFYTWLVVSLCRILQSSVTFLHYLLASVLLMFSLIIYLPFFLPLWKFWTFHSDISVIVPGTKYFTRLLLVMLSIQ